ncbi:spore coat protein [Metabacillus indicus]|jgi:spore coat protein X|uniref:spore coat protein n=1 Tax=Metabacillus indicus TaxID=246786 RepID=UPI002A05F59A|nr:spore coat protein [Metabacillus indicus]MDX8288451.1 spore coat protein [Metabacillus indicus]
MGRNRVIFSDCAGTEEVAGEMDMGGSGIGNANGVSQRARQSVQAGQRSTERISIVDSTDVNVLTIDVQAALALQAAIQAAIVLIIRLSFADDIEQADRFSEELFQFTSIDQVNEQEILIKDSHNVNVGALDLDLVITIQLLIQVLAALALSLDIL